MADNTQMKEILAKLDDGVQTLFESDKYAEYLSVMSWFHNYSTRNTLLIYAQKPDAHKIAGYSSWKNNFNRQVKKGERGIKILAPIAVKNVKESAVLDPVTKQPIIDEYGNAVTETVERTFARFKTVSVFDIGQTEGEPLPELAETLTGDVERYELFMDSLRAVSPLPIHFEQLPETTDGVCRFGDRIAIREGMSEVQTIAAVIHEMAHAKVHDKNSIDGFVSQTKQEEEITAESIAYVVSQRFGIETGANSFGYIGSYLKNKEAKALQNTLDTIRKAAAELIDGIDEKYQALAKERGIDLTIAAIETIKQAAVTSPQIQKVPEISIDKPAKQTLTALKLKALDYAKQHAHLPLQTRINIIANAFNCKSGVIEKGLCSGKWRGYTDVSIRFDNGASVYIGTRKTPETKDKSVIDELVNNTLASFDPEIITESKALATTALVKREVADNAIAAELGLKPYKFLNVEINDGSAYASGGYIGCYFVTLEVNGKIVNHLETGLGYDVANGTVSEMPKPTYYAAGGLKDKDVDYVFNGVGFSSTNDSYSLETSKDVLERAEKALEARRSSEGETPMQSKNLTPADKEFWQSQIADLLANNGGKMELSDLELAPFNNHGGLGKFFEVFGKNTFEREFANIIALENTKRTGEPWVVFNFCEGGAYRPDCLRTPTAMRFSEADAFLRQYEPKVREILQADGGGYDKLDYTIYIKRADNEVYPLSDRYDIGDSKNVSGLYNVIKAETDYYYANPTFFGDKPTDAQFAADKKRDYADIAILKAAVAPEYPYVEVEKVVRYADGDRLDQKIFNRGEILTFAEADSKIKTSEKAIRDRNISKYGSPGDGDEELGIAVHFKLPGESEPGVFRVSYLLGDYDEERSGLLKRFEMGADYYNACVRNGDYGNVNAMLGGKDADDAIRLAAEYTKIHEVLRDSMPDAIIQTVDVAVRLPDTSVSIAEMNAFGYTTAELLPLSQARAIELFESGNPVYLLYPDNTEAMVFDADEIKTHDGFCGIELSDWERIQAAEISSDSESSREADLLYGSEDKFGIYQVKDGAEFSDYRYESTAELKQLGLDIDRSNYNLVYTAPLLDTAELGGIFVRFNMNPPDDFTGHTLSMGDIIVFQRNNVVSSHYLDRGGYAELPAFTGAEGQQPTYSQVENRSDEKYAPTMAELEADVKSGKSISLMDLTTAINNVPERPSAQKGKPDFLAKIAANKQRVAQASQPTAQKDNQLEV